MTGVALGVPAGALMPQVPTPCLAKLDARPWHKTLAVRTGGFVTGVRTSSAFATERLNEWLGPLRAPELDSVVAPNFSLEVGDEAGSRRHLHLVYRDHEIVGRRRLLDEVLVDLIALLDEAARLGVNDRIVVHASGVLDADGQVVLVPARMQSALLTRRRQLEEAGLTLLPNRTHLIDAQSDEVVMDLVDQSLATLAQTTPLFGGRRRLRAWCLPGKGEHVIVVGAAQGVYVGFSNVVNRQLLGAAPVLYSLARLASNIRFFGLPEVHSSRLAESLISLTAAQTAG